MTVRLASNNGILWTRWWTFRYHECGEFYDYLEDS